MKAGLRDGIGKSGNDILKECLATMNKEGIEGMIYSHPIGDWGHSSGTLLGKSVTTSRQLMMR